MLQVSVPSYLLHALLSTKSVFSFFYLFYLCFICFSVFDCVHCTDCNSVNFSGDCHIHFVNFIPTFIDAAAWASVGHPTVKNPSPQRFPNET